jgi:hypothetical protein
MTMNIIRGHLWDGVQANGLQYLDSPLNGTGLETMK